MLPNELYHLCREKYIISKYRGCLIQNLPPPVFKLCCRLRLYSLFSLNQETLEWALEQGYTPIFDYAVERSKAFYLRSV